MEKEKPRNCQGPDQLIGDEDALELTTTRPDGAIRLRKYEEDCSDKYPPVSVPTMLKNTAQRYPSKQMTFIKISFQVEHLYYSTIDDPKHDITEGIGLNGNISRFMKIEESAMCMVCLK